jgi:serine/threonine-protein kinase RsbW
VNLDVAICLPQEAKSVSVVRGIVSDALRRLGVIEESIGDVTLALSEACTNVLDHVAGEDEYEVEMRLDHERCSIRVKNTGKGFDAAALTGVTPDASSERGRGVAIMRDVMDHVDFESEPETGTIVHLVKTLRFHADADLLRSRPGRRAP